MPVWIIRSCFREEKCGPVQFIFLLVLQPVMVRDYLAFLWKELTFQLYTNLGNFLEVKKQRLSCCSCLPILYHLCFWRTFQYGKNFYQRPGSNEMELLTVLISWHLSSESGAHNWNSLLSLCILGGALWWQTGSLTKPVRDIYMWRHPPPDVLEFTWNSNSIQLQWLLFSYVFYILFKIWTAPLKDRHTQNQEVE